MEAYVISYVAAMSAREQRAEWQLALALLSRMTGANVDSTPIISNAAIVARKRREEGQLALALLSRMTAGAKVDSTSIISNVTIDVLALRADRGVYYHVAGGLFKRTLTNAKWLAMPLR